MALNVGTLTAMLKLDASGAVKEAQKFAKEIEKTARVMEQAGKKAAAFGAMLTAPIVLALRSAGKHSPEVAEQLDRVNRAFQALAAEIAKAVLPVVREFANGVASVAKWLQDMDPATKQAIFGFVELAAKVALAVAAFGQLASFAGLAAKAFSLLLGPMGAVLATVAVVVVAASVIRQAWEDNLFGIQEVSSATWKAVKEGASGAASFLTGEFHATISGIIKLFDTLVVMWRAVLKGLGRDDPFAGVEDTIRNILKTVDEIPKHLTRDLQDGAKAVAGYVAKGAGHLVEDAKKLLKGLFGSLPGGAGLFAGGEVDVGGKAGAGGSHDFMRGIGSQKAETSVGKAVRETLEAQQKRLADAALQAANALQSKFIARLGTAADVISSAMQGMAAGGPWGAIIAVFVDLVTRSRQFMQALAVVEDGLMMLADTFGRMFGSGSKVNEAHNKILGLVTDLIGPIFDAISEAFGILAPVLDALSATIKPVLSIVGDVLKPVFELFGMLLKGVAMILLGIIRGIQGVWNLIIEAIAGIIGWFDQKAAWEFRKKKADTTATDEAMKGLWESTTANTVAQQHQAEAVERATEALFNVPTGYKVALARLQAINTSGGGGIISGGTVASGGSGVVVYGNVTVKTDDPAAMQRKIIQVQRKNNGRSNPEYEGD